MSLKKIIKEFIPPILEKILLHIMSNSKNTSIYNEISWLGDYKSWEDACNNSTGYEDGLILNRVKESVLKVKNGEAFYERDSVIFDQIQYSWPLLAALLTHAIKNNNKINVLDFGGSLGSSYFQNRGYLEFLDSVYWSIVEQSHFVECGKKCIESEDIKFYSTIEGCISDRNPDLLLLSGVIQCLDDPYVWIRKFASYQFKYIIVDRTSFIDDSMDRLTVEKVPSFIYKASYPSWFFNYTRFVEAFLNSNYVLVSEFDSYCDPSIVLEDGKEGFWKGFIFQKVVSFD